MSDGKSALRTAELELEEATDLDAQRMALARIITILNSNFETLWPACPNRRCQRERSCVAPDGVCAMETPIGEEELHAAWPAVLPEILRAIHERLAELGVSEDQ
jgi:hypothetical protein